MLSLSPRSHLTASLFRFTLLLLAFSALCGSAFAGPLKTHRIFSANMVLQRGKPVVIWGWAEPGKSVSVQLGNLQSEVVATGAEGRWEVSFPAQEADGVGRKLTVTSSPERIELDNVVFGDVWVMNGQSNMAFALKGVNDSDFEIPQAHLPLLRFFRISTNESYAVQTDIPEAKVTGWSVCSPENAGDISAIGYAFASRVQRATGIPIGVIDNSRGGASLESLVPRRKFESHPLAKAYADAVEKRRAEFDVNALVAKKVADWEKKAEADKKAPPGAGKKPLPPKPTREDLRTWDIPGESPSDAGACYNGMFGIFKGLNIKGVVFHQGFNNRFDCRPNRYRLLMKLMVEGWREDFNDPTLPVCVIGGCGDGEVQTRDNFELLSLSEPSYIREAQRLGLADVGDPARTVFIPDYDVRIPGLHPKKKLTHGYRAARWALSVIYDFGKKMEWDSGEFVSSEKQGDVMVLTFSKKVMPDDMSRVLEGFSIADASGKFYLAHAAHPNVNGKVSDFTKVHVWSPLVKEPVAVRYAWASSGPMGNLKINGHEWLPLASFRTDTWNWPESEDPAVQIENAKRKAMQTDAAERLEFRRQEEAKQAVEILARLKTLGQVQPPAKQGQK